MDMDKKKQLLKKEIHDLIALLDTKHQDFSIRLMTDQKILRQCNDRLNVPEADFEKVAAEVKVIKKRYAEPKEVK